MPENHPGNGKLDSWKEIAAYLDRNVRTVIRWEKKRNLPVHRLPGGQAVFAYKAELDEWLERKKGPAVTERPTEAAASVASAWPPEATDRKNEDRHSGLKRTFLWGTVGLALIAVSMVMVWHRPASADKALTVRIQFAANAIRAYDDRSSALDSPISEANPSRSVKASRTYGEPCPYR